MTQKEEDAIKKLLEAVDRTNQALSSLKEETSKRIEHIASQVEKKHLPVYLEQDILTTAQQSIQESIKAVLSGYNSPMTKLVAEVINSYSTELKAIINDAFVSVIKTEDFKQSIVSGFAHKISRSIISNNEGLFDKVSNELKQDATFRSKLTLVVAAVVEECLKERKTA